MAKKEIELLENLLKTYSSKSQAIREALKFLYEAERNPKLRTLLEEFKKRELEKTPLRKLSEREIEYKIINFLQAQPNGATINEISEGTQLHRNTVRKYLTTLENSQVISRRRVGTSTFSFLKRRRLK